MGAGCELLTGFRGLRVATNHADCPSVWCRASQCDPLAHASSRSRALLVLLVRHEPDVEGRLMLLLKAGTRALPPSGGNWTAADVKEEDDEVIVKLLTSVRASTLGCGASDKARHCVPDGVGICAKRCNWGSAGFQTSPGGKGTCGHQKMLW